MASTEDEVSPYELLGVTLESTEVEIKTAYRQRSLKVHPDRHPNNPDAAHKFHELNQAYELLLDPIRRLALDAKVRLKEARKARFSTYDAKRKGLQQELEEREREFKKRKVEKAAEERRRDEENERIKEQGRRLREDREAARSQLQEASPPEREQSHEEPNLGPLDTTIRLRYPISQYPTLITPSALASHLVSFGPVDANSIVLSMKRPKKSPDKPPKYVIALVPFEKVGDAFALKCAAGQAHRGLADMEVSWASGTEPAVVEWLKTQGRGIPNVSPIGSRDRQGEVDEIPTFSSFPASSNIYPSSLDFESLTIMRLRQAEKERLEREIRDKEAIG